MTNQDYQLNEAYGRYFNAKIFPSSAFSAEQSLTTPGFFSLIPVKIT